MYCYALLYFALPSGKLSRLVQEGNQRKGGTKKLLPNKFSFLLGPRFGFFQGPQKHPHRGVNKRETENHILKLKKEIKFNCSKAAPQKYKICGLIQVIFIF